MLSPHAPLSTAGRRTAAAAFAVAAALALGACAPTETKQLEGTAGQVQTAVEKFSDAAADGHAGVICRDLVTAELRKQLASHGKSCEDAVRAAIDNSDYTPLTIDVVKLPKGDDGKTAVAVTKTSQENKFRAVNLEKVDDKWQISSFETSYRK